MISMTGRRHQLWTDITTHSARVTILPPAWLTSFDILIRSFVSPFIPRSSLDFICNPKNQGGLGLVQLTDQVLALHNVYIQRLVAPKHDNPLTGLINVFVRLYIGHNSILPFLLASQLYKSTLRKNHLTYSVTIGFFLHQHITKRHSLSQSDQTNSRDQALAHWLLPSHSNAPDILFYQASTSDLRKYW
ncbi:hypothetical protein BC941DRAFT_475792 [Chlamydoabsidia padenii]|nr:hypothetical protein BC941DRAFT_475792 [Chlamydoabsidia padenii]